jgi:hypothetical protein
VLDCAAGAGEVYADWDIDQLAETMRAVSRSRVNRSPALLRTTRKPGFMEAAGIEPASAVVPT